MKKIEFVSVVIPTYNRKKILKKTVAGLLSQTYPEEGYEIIIIDDGSKDGTAEMIKSLKSPIVRLRCYRQENKGPAAARNLGIKKAKGSVIAFIDDDCLVPSNWIESLINAYKKNPEVVGVGGKVIPSSNSIVAKIENYKCLMLYGKRDKEMIGGSECPTGFTGNMSYKKRVLEEVGGFGKFKVASKDDIDLKNRICSKGYKVLFIPLAVIHMHNYNFSYLIKQLLEKGAGKRKEKKLFISFLINLPIIFFGVLSKFLRYRKTIKRK